MKKLEENNFVKEVIDNLTNEKPLAIGVFGSSAYYLKKGSDVDMYVLAENKRGRTVVEKGGYMFEIYHADPGVIKSNIRLGDIRTVDRMRSSKSLYDPQKIYEELIKMATRKNLRYAEWIEKTIIGDKYDMVERTDKSIEKELYAGRPIAAANSVRYLVDRIMDVGFRRLNLTTQAKPEKVPRIVGLLPEPMQRIHERTFRCAKDYQVKELMQLIKDEKENLFPKVK